MKKSKSNTRDIKTQLKELKELLQSEISNIKRSMQENQGALAALKINLSELDQKITRIESILEKSEINYKHETKGTKFVNYYYIVGSFSTAVGFGVMGVSASFWSSALNIALVTKNPIIVSYTNLEFILLFICGCLMSIGGILMIGGAHRTSINFEKYPIEDWETNFPPKIEDLKNIYRSNFLIFLGNLFMACSLLAMFIVLVFEVVVRYKLLSYFS